MGSLLLNKEEFAKLHDDFFGEGSSDCSEIDDTDLCYKVAKAQLKKVVEWGDESCPHILTQIMDGSETKKRNCDACWQALLKEVE